jgi:hypothetical protein
MQIVWPDWGLGPGGPRSGPVTHRDSGGPPSPTPVKGTFFRLQEFFMAALNLERGWSEGRDKH